MNATGYFELFRYLMEQRCLRQEDVVFVDNVRDWCLDKGIPETDGERPMRLVSGDGEGCRMVVRREIPEGVIEERIRAMAIRWQVTNVAVDRSALLDIPEKRLAFLFLREFAFSLPGVDDDMSADEWAFAEMERLGYFGT